MLAILGPVLGAIGSVAKSWLDTRKVKAEGKVKIAAAKVEAKVKETELKGQMDLASVDGMKHSWKDEFLVILLALPYVACFIPPLAPYVYQGFQILENATPEWYQWAFLGAIVASFGLRTWKGWGK